MEHKHKHKQHCNRVAASSMAAAIAAAFSIPLLSNSSPLDKLETAKVINAAKVFNNITCIYIYIYNFYIHTHTHTHTEREVVKNK